VNRDFGYIGNGMVQCDVHEAFIQITPLGTAVVNAHNADMAMC
jgi:hypothetical protein